MSNPEVTFPARYTPVSALAYAGPDGAAEVVAVDKPLPVTAGATAFALPDGSLRTVSSSSPLPVVTGPTAFALPDGSVQSVANASPLPVVCAPLPTGSAHIGNVFIDDVPDGPVVSGSVTAAAIIVSSALTGYAGGAFQVLSSGSGCTITYEHSVDGTTWLALPVLVSNIATGTPSATSTSNGIYSFGSSAAFVRARVSVYGSGTVSVALVLKRRPLNVIGTSLAGGNAAIGTVGVTGTVTVSGTVNTNTGYTDSTATLASLATFTGTGRANSSAQNCFFNATAFADAGGTLFIEQSLDTGATYQPIASAPLVAGGAAQLSVRVAGAYTAATLYRVRYVNGALAQGMFRLSSAYSAR
ncbi:hypothetical protein HGI47_16755 [Novosphingobium sp. ERN07]|uniref:hypothetical protein n=1 Tax=Novosphingobium sp. ERN07 TaxID=2726187 RepID=UPI0014565FED|nr:hypothetical protein [Novosphingobium sp. ERN07]NLR72528.1 hypothetical protein [Novosphingobium sp. ERN07]